MVSHLVRDPGNRGGSRGRGKVTDIALYAVEEAIRRSERKE